MHKLSGFFFDWFSKRIRKPRLWEDREWQKLVPLERCWVWYKHHLYLKGIGSAEVDQVTDPLKELVLYGGIILSNVLAALVYLEIEMSYFQVLFVVGILVVVFEVANFLFQWWVGNKIDKKDLTALMQEIGNRRNKVFREIRQAQIKKEFRKKL